MNTIAYLQLPSGIKLDVISFDFSKSTSPSADIGYIRVASTRTIRLAEWNTEPEINQPMKTNVSKLSGKKADLSTEALPIRSETADVGDALTIGYECSLHAKQGERGINIEKLFISRGGIQLERVSNEPNTDGTYNRIYNIEVTDERRFWQERGVVSKSFNVPYDYGVTVLNGEGLFAENTVKGVEGGFELYTLQEIMAHLVSCLPNHRESAYGFVWAASGYEKELPLDINVRGGASAIQTMTSLANRYDLLVTYLSGNRVGVVKAFRRVEPSDGYLSSVTFSEEHLVDSRPKWMPQWLPITYQVGSSMPIIKDAECRLLDMVAQNPTTSRWEAYNFAGAVVKVGDFGVGLTFDEFKQQALQTLGGKGFELPQIPKEWQESLRRSAFRTYRMVDAELPVTRERMLPDEDGILTKRPHYVNTSWVEATDVKDPSAGQAWISQSGEMPESKYRIDSNGIIQFSELIGSIGDGSVDIDNAELTPMGATIQYQYVSDEYYLYRESKNEEDARHAHLIEVDWQQYDKHNKAELDEKAQDLAAAKWGGLSNTSFGGSYTFAGFWQIMPDGVVLQVVWQLDESGRALTKVLRNDFSGGIEGRPSERLTTRSVKNSQDLVTRAGGGITNIIAEIWK